jgi:hypothetical protein
MFKSSSLSNYAPLQNPTFTGKVTLPDGSTITKSTSSYLKQSDAVNTYATKSSVTSVENTLYDTVYNLNNTYVPKENPTFTGTVTFPNEAISQDAINSTYTEGWLSSLLRDHGTFLTDLYVEKAPKASPIFTGTVTFPDTSTITDYLK